MFNWLFIGAGNIAQKVANEIVGSKTNRVLLIWNRTKAKAESFAKRLKQDFLKVSLLPKKTQFAVWN